MPSEAYLFGLYFSSTDNGTEPGQANQRLAAEGLNFSFDNRSLVWVNFYKSLGFTYRAIKFLVVTRVFECDFGFLVLVSSND